KFARRHRTAVVSSSVAAVLLISAAVALALQNRRVVGERDKKSQVVSLFRDVFALSNPFVVPDAELTAREALERSLPLIEAGLQDQPDVRAELLYTTGSILRILGAVPEAIDHLGEALEIRRRLHGEGHLEVAAAMTELASAHREAGQMDVAEDLALQAVAAVREEVGDRHVALLDPLVQLVAIYCRQERWDEAAPIGEEVLVLTDELGANVRGKIIVLESLAKASSARGDYARAVELNREALGLARERYGADHPQHIATLNNIGLQLRRQEDFAGADQAYSEALRIQKLAYGEEGADAFLLNNIAGVRFAAGDYETAEAIYREALAVVLDRLGREHWQAFALGVRITRCLTLQGDAVAAEQHIRQVLAEGALAAEHWRWDEARSVLGESLSAQGRCEEAEPLLVESFENIVEKRQRIRNRDDAFQRLRVHLESCGKAEDVERYAAMVES
ncbi:MAG: tetratricopeptide repeat protein, partial [Acidobacteriota bacterium]